MIPNSKSTWKGELGRVFFCVGQISTQLFTDWILGWLTNFDSRTKIQSTLSLPKVEY